MRSYPKTPDANEKAIVDALRKVGIKVHRIEGRSGSAGVPDLLCEVPDQHAQRAAQELIDALMVTKDWPEPTTVMAGQARHVVGKASMAALELRARAHRWVLLEVKNPESAAGVKNTIKAKQLDPGGEYEDVLKYCTRKIARLCKRTQGDFLLAHDAPMHVVTTVEEALAACGVEAVTAARAEPRQQQQPGTRAAPRAARQSPLGSGRDPTGTER